MSCGGLSRKCRGLVIIVSASRPPGTAEFESRPGAGGPPYSVV